MRTRTNSTEPYGQSLHVYGQQLNPPLQQDYGWVYWRQRAKHGLIVDDNRRIKARVNGHGVQAFKPVSHDQYTLVQEGTPTWVSTGSNTRSFVSTGELVRVYCLSTVGLPILSDWMYTIAVSHELGDIFDGHYDRWQAVKPTMQSRVSLSSFLYELREITSLWKILPKRHLRTKRGRVLQGWEETMRYLRTSQNGVQWLNGLHLNYAFGWKPFVNDLKGLFEAKSQFEPRLRRYLKYADRQLVRRFRDNTLNESLTWTLPLGFWTVRFRLLRAVERASSFDFTYNSPVSWDDPNFRVRAWADFLGANVNPSTIWAVLPWSWFVDYFANIGRALESNEDDWLHTSVSLAQGCASRSVKGSLKVDVMGGYDSSYTTPMEISFSQYIRRLGLPHFSLETEDLNADKIRLGASALFTFFR